MLKFIGRLLKRTLFAVIFLVVLLLLPVGYIEVFCQQSATPSTYQAIITNPKQQRVEANSYLTYPEWHIVYAYEELAKVLETGDEHAFGYMQSISAFWKSFCALNQVAGSHGGADFQTRATIHTIGVSFTLEMGAKALYEETLGRLFALIRGRKKTPQDIYVAKMAKDYARFLQQVPWYKYDFNKSTSELWRLPVTDTLRSWERRFALGGEWKAKAAYAQVIAQAVAATGQARLTIQSVVSGITSTKLAAIDGVKIMNKQPGYILMESPRYRKFTHILENVVSRGGKIVEIAGNDDIMISAISTSQAAAALKNGHVISILDRDGGHSHRILINVQVRKLAALLQELQVANLKLEHIYDY